MKFDYNCNCNFTERTAMVTKEIMDEYPEIEKEIAMKMAAFSNAIDTKVKDTDVFRRYYYMLLFLKKGTYIYDKVYKDMIKYCSYEMDNEVYNDLREKIKKYTNNELEKYPSISDYYG